MSHLAETQPQIRMSMHCTWAAFHSRRDEANGNGEQVTSLTALLPLFPDASKSVAMIRHSMNVVKKAVEVLNHGQVPVIACDQPLYKIAKEVQ